MASVVHFENAGECANRLSDGRLGTRFCAWVIDTLFCHPRHNRARDCGHQSWLRPWGIALDSGGAKAGCPRPATRDEVRLYFFARSGARPAIGSLLYFTTTELLVRGQTIGKRACGLRVVKADGFALEAGSVLVRNVFRVIDQIPAFWIVPLALHSQASAFGDMVAGTLVVAETQDGIGELRARLMARDASGEPVPALMPPC